MTKNKVLIIIVIVWTVFAGGYMGKKQWQKAKFKKVQVAYQEGFAETIRELMARTDDCEKPVPISNGEVTANVVSMECLQQKQATEEIE